MKKNIVRLNEAQLKKIIAESVREVLKEWEKPEDWQETEFKGTYTDKDGALYMPDDDIPEDETYAMLTDGYNLKTGEICGLDGGRGDYDEFADEKEVFETIKYWAEHYLDNKNNTYYDDRVNGYIPLFSVGVYDGYQAEKVGNKVYMSNSDGKYYAKIKSAIKKYYGNSTELVML
jgi:hypothetical protein